MHQTAHHEHSDVKNIKVAFFLNLAFTIIEFIGGIFTNSLAILSDALHDLGDSVSLGLAWYFQKQSKKGKTENFTYGYKRFSLLGAIINAIILFSGSAYILTKSIPALWNPNEPNAKGMIAFAILGVIVNGFAALRLKSGHSQNEKVVMMHLLEDALGWAAVLIGAILLYFFDLPIIDPLLSIGISIFIIYNVVKNIRKSFGIILQKTPDNVLYNDIKDILLANNAVQSVHDLHIWSLDGNYNVLTVHIVLNKCMDSTELFALKHSLRHQLEHKNIQHSTFEIEFIDEKCSMHECCE